MSDGLAMPSLSLAQVFNRPAVCKMGLPGHKHPDSQAIQALPIQAKQFHRLLRIRPNA